MLEDLMSYHTSTLEVAEIAKEANIKKVVLTHLLPRMVLRKCSFAEFLSTARTTTITSLFLYR